MTGDPPTILLIGYGNPGRRDDGLGPAVADAVAALALDGVTVETDYQLQVELAPAIAAHDIVVFVDADAAGTAPYTLRPVAPREHLGFTSHSVAPDALLALARDLFGGSTRGYVLGVRGDHFDAFGERLSAPARANLRAALDALVPALRTRRLDELADTTAGGSAPCSPASSDSG